METKKEKKKAFLSVFQDSIQLRFYRKENFEQVGSMDLSPKSIYVFISSFLLLLLIISFLLLAYTPLQRLIPRLSSIENASQFVQLSNTLDEIDAQINAQNTYNTALQKLLTGDQTVNLSELEIIDVKPETSELKAEKESPSKQIESINQTNPSVEPLSLGTGSLFDDMDEVNFYTPLNGLISADFDPALEHYGVDIIAPADSPVKVIAAGNVFIAEWNLETGYTIGIQHDNNVLSFYKHNSKLVKKKGDFVKGGEIIAIIGNSGRLTTGPHLHFEIWHNGKPVNPNDYIKFNNE